MSTIVNPVAYKAIAVDFELWSKTRKEIQRVHLEHFITILQTSRYKGFNIKQRFAKLGLVQQLIFVFQTDWYSSDESVGWMMDVLKVAMQASFTKDEAIKPLVTYLAANLDDGPFLTHLLGSIPLTEDIRRNCAGFCDSRVSSITSRFSGRA